MLDVDPTAGKLAENSEGSKDFGFQWPFEISSIFKSPTFTYHVILSGKHGNEITVAWKSSRKNIGFSEVIQDPFRKSFPAWIHGPKNGGPWTSFLEKSSFSVSTVLILFFYQTTMKNFGVIFPTFSMCAMVKKLFVFLYWHGIRIPNMGWP